MNLVPDLWWNCWEQLVPCTFVVSLLISVASLASYPDLSLVRDLLFLVQLMYCI